MKLFQTLVINPRFDWCLLRLDDCVAYARDGVICALGGSIETVLCRYTTFLRFFYCFKQFLQQGKCLLDLLQGGIKMVLLFLFFLT